MILHVYFARRFILTLMVITGVLFALVMLVDLVEQTRKFSGLDLGWQKLLGLTLLNTPQTINLILPLIMILATVALFISLARSSELVVTRAAGRSALAALVSPLVVALIIGVMAVGMLNPIVAATGKRYLQLSESYRAGGAAALSISGEGLWLRQGDETGQTVIRALRSNLDASVLYDVTFLTYAPEGGPVQRIEAASAALTDGQWSLRQAKASSRRHQVWLHTELARPVFLMAMVLVASAFTMRHTRFGGTGVAVLASVLLGFGLYFIRSFAQILGENGQIPVLLAAWAPPAAAVLLSLGLLLHAEDG